VAKHRNSSIKRQAQDLVLIAVEQLLHPQLHSRQRFLDDAVLDEPTVVIIIAPQPCGKSILFSFKD
jgi:ABC-type uncharacterized transport system YnjBCD ATPase subunit